MGMDLGKLNQDVIAMHEGMACEALLETYQRVQFAYEAAREIRDRARQAMIDWMEANQVQEITIDDQRSYRLKVNKRVSCRDAAATGHRLLESSGGDLDKVFGLLASNPWKHGSCRKLLGDDGYAACFETTVVQDVQMNRPRVDLVVQDKRFGRRTTEHRA